MPLIFDGVCLEFRGNYLLKAFASKFNKQILDMKITKFLPLESRGTLYNSVNWDQINCHQILAENLWIWDSFNDISTL